MKIAVRNLTKQYLLKTALDNVTLSFDEGKIHALVGENGAGKSTLATIICGDVKPTFGTVLLEDKNVSFSCAKDALQNGIVLVHQRPLLSSSLTVNENIILNESNSFFVHSPTKKLLELKKIWAPSLNLNDFVKDLGGNMRFYTSLLCALTRNPKCLILDEPSAFLDIQEREVLYKNLRELANKNVTIIVITHSTAEATKYADNVTVLSEGKLISQFSDTTEYKKYIETKQISFNSNFLDKTNKTNLQQNNELNSICCIKFNHVCSRPKRRPALLDATVEVPYGKITCIAGIKEAALGTLEDVFTGMKVLYTKGTVTFTSPDAKQTQTISFATGKFNSSFLRKKKTAIVPSDRSFRAANPNVTVEQMLSVYTQKNTKEVSLSLIKNAGVNITPEQKVSDLSGGMLQRLILARELSINPDLLILCNPMQGLDINSQSSLCKKIVYAADCGKAVLIIGTADFPLSLCSNVYTLEAGRTTLSFRADKSTAEKNL